MYRLKGWALLALAAISVALIAGCGGSHRHAHAPRVYVHPTQATVNATVKADTGRPCSASDLAMQCKLVPQPLPARVAQLVSLHMFSANAARVIGTYGVDFAWGGPRSCAAMHSIGARFAISYFSHDPGKNWTRALVDQFHSCGVATVGGWESTGTRATQGYSAGVADAHAAAAQAAAVGNTDRPLWFAIDFDANGPEVLSYFQGVHAVLGARTEAYGSYRAILYLFNHGAVGRQNFQTYAWSRGLWLPASIAPLEQYLNGSSYDNDRAIAADFGQWPYTAAVPAKAKPHLICFGKKARLRNATCKRVRARVAKQERAEKATRKALGAVRKSERVHRCVRPYRRGVCVRAGRSDVKLAKRAQWFHTHAAATRKQYS